jgi:hypothetical protein
MSPRNEAALIEECEALRRTVSELNVQVNSVAQRLAALPAKPPEMRANDRIGAEGLATIAEAIIPAIRQAIRAEWKALKPLDEAWYEPSELEAMSCGKVKANTIRKWLRWGQIDGESDGQQVRIYKSTVEDLRKNKWRPLRQADPSKVPASKRPEGSSS